MTRRFRILVTDPWHADGRLRLEQESDFEVLEHPRPATEQLHELLPDIDGWIVRSGTRIRAEDLAHAARLRVVARAGVGVDNIDVAAATRRGILVVNAPDAHAITTAELAIAHLLSLARHLVAGDRMVREGRWDRSTLVGTEVEGKTLGILGLGRIGRQVARKAAGIGLQVLAHDPYVAPAAVADLDLELVERDVLLARSDFVSLHAPLSEATRGMLDSAAFAAMKPGARLINCARAALIDEPALLEALHAGQVAAAALDVFREEPPPPDDPLLALPQVLSTPHLGASTREASREVARATAEQVIEALRSGRVAHAVNLPPLEIGEDARPFLDLARTAGRFLAQVVEWPIARVRANYRGEIAERDMPALTLSFLQGLLDGTFDQPVNLVNARPLAEEKGIVVEELRSAEPRDFSSLLDFEAETPAGCRRVGGTLFGRRMPRLVVLDDARMEIIPEETLLVLRNEDRPGVVGRIGTALGRHAVNILDMSVSRQAPDGLCTVVVGVSMAPDAALQRELLDAAGIHELHVVDLT